MSVSGHGIEVTGFGAGADRSVARRKRAGGDVLANRDRSGNYLPPESEAAFQKWLIGVAKWYGWKAVHYRTTRRSGGRGAHAYSTPIEGDAGGPDVLLAKAGRLPILAELKTDKGIVSPNQQEWADAIHPDCYRLWRPRDREAIITELSM